MFHRQILRSAAVIALIASASACTTVPTPYQPYRPEAAGGVHGGYSEQRLAPDRYKVLFHGNEWTSRDRVEGYLLYRSAELALENGYDSFVIVDRHTEHDVQTYVRPDPYYQPWYGNSYGYWRPHWRYQVSGAGWVPWHPEYGGPFWTDRVDVNRVESFEAEAEIVLKRGLRGEERAFDARRVIADLGPTIVLPRP